MIPYPHIDSIYKRNMNTGEFITGEWACTEFEYLANNNWIWTEKVDGTNIRVIWVPDGFDTSATDLHWGVQFKGKTDKADIPKHLLAKLTEIFTPDKFVSAFAKTPPICLYGEGFGAKINSGENYIKDGVDFVLFDCRINNWWLRRNDVEGISEALGIQCVPTIGGGSLFEAISLVRSGFTSRWGNFIAEGLVIRPPLELRNRSGQRIITKIKHKDFIPKKINKEERYESKG